MYWKNTEQDRQGRGSIYFFLPCLSSKRTSPIIVMQPPHQRQRRLSSELFLQSLFGTDISSLTKAISINNSRLHSLFLSPLSFSIFLSFFSSFPAFLSFPWPKNSRGFKNTGMTRPDQGSVGFIPKSIWCQMLHKKRSAENLALFLLLKNRQPITSS